MANEEHKAALGSLSQQLEVAQNTAKRLAGTTTYIISNTLLLTHSPIHPRTRTLILLLTHTLHIS